MNSDLIVDLNQASDWVVSILEEVPEYNQAFPYFYSLKNISELKQTFGTGELDDQRAEMTRGWHVIVKRENEYIPQRVGNRGVSSFLYGLRLINFWSHHSNGASLRDSNRHISAVMTKLQQIKKKQDNLDFKIIDCFVSDIDDCLWPAPGGRLHHKSVIEIQLSQRKRVL